MFVLLTGYFQIKADRWRTQGMVRLWLEVSFYTLLCGLIGFSCGAEPLSISSIRLLAAHTLFPIGMNNWWFITAYLTLSLMIPFLNRLLNGLSRQQYLQMLVIFGILWSLIPTFFPFDYGFSNLIWFIYIYSIAGFIRLHAGLGSKKNLPFFFLAGGFCYLLNYALTVCIDLLVPVFPFLSRHVDHLYQSNSLLMLCSSILIFMEFRCLRIKSSLINQLASVTFIVYLLHDAQPVRIVLWPWLKAMIPISSIWFIPLTTISIILVYCVCLAAALLIQHFLNPVLTRTSSAIAKKISAFSHSVFKEPSGQ